MQLIRHSCCISVRSIMHSGFWCIRAAALLHCSVLNRSMMFKCLINGMKFVPWRYTVVCMVTRRKHFISNEISIVFLFMRILTRNDFEKCAFHFSNFCEKFLEIVRVTRTNIFRRSVTLESWVQRPWRLVHVVICAFKTSENWNALCIRIRLRINFFHSLKWL